jgi:hypothetical protein
VNALFEETLQGIDEMSGVSAAAVSLTLPYERGLNLPFQLAAGEDYRVTNFVYVTPDYFSALDIPLLQGRLFEDMDRAAEPVVAVADQAFVDRYLSDRETLGSILEVPCCGLDRLTLVGVVGTVQQSAGWGGVLQPVWETPTLYVSASQMSTEFFALAHVPFSPSWLVRGTADVAPQVTQLFRRTAPDLAVTRVTSLEKVMDDAFERERLQAALLVAVAAFTLLLALVGLYGIVAHEAQERRGEIGLRLALGASPGRSVLSAATKGVLPTVQGLVLGVGGGLLLARFLLEPFIFGLSPQDPVTIAGVVVILLVVASAASLLPALRTARVDPAEVLKAA